MARRGDKQQKSLEAVLGRIRSYRFLALPVWDGVALAMGWLVAYGLIVPRGTSMVVVWAIDVVAVLVCGSVIGLYRGRWAVASFFEVRALGTCYLISTAVVLVAHPHFGTA